MTESSSEEPDDRGAARKRRSAAISASEWERDWAGYASEEVFRPPDHPAAKKRRRRTEDVGFIDGEGSTTETAEEIEVSKKSSTRVSKGASTNLEVINNNEGQGESSEEEPGYKGNKPKKKIIETVGVMFVDQTVMGMLAKEMQKAEDSIAKMVGYRVRVVESSGTQLCRLLRKKLDKSSCTLCNPQQEEGARKKKEDNIEGQRGIYVGESGRSLHERFKEHRVDFEAKSGDSHILKHWWTREARL